MVIDHGRLMYDGSLGGLHTAGGAGESERTLVVDLERELPPIEVGEAARVVKVDGPRQWLAFPAAQSAAPLVARIAAEYPLVDLSVREPDIEAVIAKMYAEREGERAAEQAAGRAVGQESVVPGPGTS
jgi:ABC-2 type transport system ATP-binding protein